MSDLGEAVRTANAELTANHDEPKSDRSSEPKERAPKESKVTDRQETRQNERQEISDDDIKGAPKWTKQWTKKTREALKKLHSLEGAAELMPDLYSEVENRYDYTGKMQAEFDRYKQRWSPYEPIMGTLEQSAALRGMSPQTALQQYMQVSNMLASDPDQALMWLASQVKPRDAQKLLQGLSQQYGVDIGQLVQSQDWIDPAVQKLVSPLQQQIQQQNQLIQGYLQMQQGQAQNQIASALQAFANATNEDGTPKFPHRQRLDPIMARMVLNGDTRPLEQMYEDAMWQVPELREELLEQRAREAEQRAIQDAKNQTREVEEAQRASRNVNGGTKSPKPKNSADLRETIMQVSKKLTNR